MSIENFYQNFIESEHYESAQATAAICNANDEKQSEAIMDEIEDDLHRGFVFGFIAGINFMKGAIR